MKTKNLIAKIFTILFSALLILPLFTDFVTNKVKMGSETGSEGIKLGDLTNLDLTKSGGAMEASKVLFYITFALAMVLLVLVVISFFVKDNKILNLAIKVCGALVVVLAIVTFILATVWCSKNSVSETVDLPIVGKVESKITITPWFGGIAVLVFGVIAGVASMFVSKNK